MKKTKDVLIDKFHIKYEEERLYETTTWLGVPIWKLPFDAWMIQELIFKTRPDYIIETGTNLCGSALFYASIQDLIGYGKIITIDIEKKFDFEHERIIFFEGSSTDKKIVDKICEITCGRNNMLILDSLHTKEHVLNEIKEYSHLVASGNYLIVEDTHVNGNPIKWKWGAGPMEAVNEFLKSTDKFIIDKSCERLGLTFNPNGYLRRIK